mmetsp:Transcript_3313/g.10401  ORF Transcript_3313/g.10401 Transcript_3313/m.10401 type:complete len:219 (+) Transcript_3313:1117-1773(+)
MRCAWRSISRACLPDAEPPPCTTPTTDGTPCALTADMNMEPFASTSPSTPEATDVTTSSTSETLATSSAPTTSRGAASRHSLQRSFLNEARTGVPRKPSLPSEDRCTESPASVARDSRTAIGFTSSDSEKMPTTLGYAAPGPSLRSVRIASIASRRRCTAFCWRFALAAWGFAAFRSIGFSMRPRLRRDTARLLLLDPLCDLFTCLSPVDRCLCIAST